MVLNEEHCAPRRRTWSLAWVLALGACATAEKPARQPAAPTTASPAAAKRSPHERLAEHLSGAARRAGIARVAANDLYPTLKKRSGIRALRQVAAANISPGCVLALVRELEHTGRQIHVSRVVLTASKNRPQVYSVTIQVVHLHRWPKPEVVRRHRSAAWSLYVLARALQLTGVTLVKAEVGATKVVVRYLADSRAAAAALMRALRRHAGATKVHTGKVSRSEGGVLGNLAAFLEHADEGDAAPAASCTGGDPGRWAPRSLGPFEDLPAVCARKLAGAVKAPSAGAPHTWRVDAASLKKALAGIPPRGGWSAQPLPEFSASGPAGVMLLAIQSGCLLHRLGLRGRDKLLALDGHPLGHHEPVKTMARQFDTPGRVTLEVVRGGKTLTLTYLVE